MANNSFPQKERDSLSLLELNQKIKRTLEKGFLDNYWIKAEMSDVRVNASSGHCYLEFVEKEPLTGQLVAKVRGTIWARVFRMLKPYFESETGQLFTSGIKVLVLVSVEFHEVYGLNLTVLDIDPTYTLGDIARRRLEIIKLYNRRSKFKYPNFNNDTNKSRNRRKNNHTYHKRRPTNS